MWKIRAEPRDALTPELVWQGWMSTGGHLKRGKKVSKEQIRDLIGKIIFAMLGYMSRLAHEQSELSEEESHSGQLRRS